MAYRAERIEQDPLQYFLEMSDGEPFLQVGDVILRANQNPKEIFAQMIRLGTGSKWSHSAIVYLVKDPYMGYDNTFLVQAMTRGINIASWRNEVLPFHEFNVGIKRPQLDWYVENESEKACHSAHDPEDTHGISYLRHVRGMAMDQVNGLYDQKTVYELAALYAKRAAQRHLNAVPQVADALQAVADILKKWDEHDTNATNVLRFICSGLVQYSFFEALRRRIMNGIDIPAHRDAALSNLSNLHCVIFREDPDGIIPEYIHNVQNGRIDIHDPAPAEVLDFLKTSTPADFNNSPHLAWRYVILEGNVWRIHNDAPVDYQPASKEETVILETVKPEHHSKED